MTKKAEKFPDQLTDYRFKDKKRKYITPAGLASQGKVEEAPKLEFDYNPHLPPVLRFDDSGQTDKLPELLEKALRSPLTEDESKILANALKKHEPWLEWTGKREKKAFEVDPIALHIHERISTQAILKVAKRENIQRDLFADPEMEYREAIKFYQHEMDWANRLILGDSLQVMASLAYRENLTGQVQMIYFDPPYGIRFTKNFQPEVGRTDTKEEQESDFNREPEVVKAYRDTWTLGTHSYLSYIRDRLILAKTLLKDSGSLFLQIGDENEHLLKSILDEVFGYGNFIVRIAVQKTGSVEGDFIKSNSDYLLWYAKERSKVLEKYTQLFIERIDKKEGEWSPDPLTSSGSTNTSTVRFPAFGKEFFPGNNAHWKTTMEGMNRLLLAERIVPQKNQIRFQKNFDDFPVKALGSIWSDTGGATDMIYVVQTATKVIARCILMTTSPGDLALDPTCGSGTTAYVAEQWGRRWITIDTSRVAVALARQRLLTAKFEHYKLKNIEKAPAEDNTFEYETVPHITLKSIAQNPALDPVFAKYDPLLDSCLVIINDALQKVDKEIRSKLLLKWQIKQKQEGKKNINEADERRWKLPTEKFEHWDVPFDTDELYPAEFKTAIETYLKIWRQKMDEVNACIQTNAEQVELVDKPEKINGVVRVSGPFTVEGVMPIEFNLDADSPIQGIDEDLETFDQATNAVSFIENILLLLKREGVVFPGNRKMVFNELRSYDSGGTMINFEGEWMNGDKKLRKVGVSVGPQHGPITGWQVENVIRTAYKHGFDDIVFAGFSFDAEAQAAIEDDSNPKVKLHLAHISPDVLMGDLLKSTGSGQVFTVMGSPRIKLLTESDGSFRIRMDGVDIYDPVRNVLIDTGADKVAAWFIDSDYDGRTFCITQAFFPDRDAWKKLEKALKGVIDPDKFEAFSGTLSLPFPVGEYKKAAVKVIDPRGNEVMKVLSLDKSY
ncbi:MAG: site-specific DNA-methyltransferase [Bacteroidales bacterium]|nr:site-specific DNA-methyltransferase [Bacteroidales bacterium]